MTTLLRPGVERILRVFYESRIREIHLRELARLTKLHGQSITRYLRTLESQKFLSSKREGNQRRYSLAPTMKLFGILTLFDIEKFCRIPVIQQQALQTYLAVLPHPPVFAILFGSTARGDATVDSDIDLLLITAGSLDVRPAEREADVLYGQRISTFKMTFSSFLRELKLKSDPVVQSALNTGYPLLNNVYYYEVLARERV